MHIFASLNYCTFSNEEKSEIFNTCFSYARFQQMKLADKKHFPTFSTIRIAELEEMKVWWMYSLSSSWLVILLNNLTIDSRLFLWLASQFHNLPAGWIYSVKRKMLTRFYGLITVSKINERLIIKGVLFFRGLNSIKWKSEIWLLTPASQRHLYWLPNSSSRVMNVVITMLQCK